MSLLVIQIPPKPRLRARGHRIGGGVDSPEATPVTEYAHVWSSDGRQVERHGRSAPALMPKADSVLAVLTDVGVSWHRLLIPKAPANRLRSALAGMMEEALLDDAERAHYALGRGAKPGEIGMIAVTDGRWLSEQLANLEAANLSVDRVVPIAWPVEPAVGHFTSAAADASAGAGAAIDLSWADANGVAVLDLQGGLARALLPAPIPADVRFSATPAASATAEAWLGAPVSLLTEQERMLNAATSPWNLRQFELARRHKGSRVLRDGWRTMLGPAWRSARIGVAVLVLVQLVGLNLWAAHLRAQVAERKTQMVSVLQTSFPQVTGVLDAPVQMLREVQTLRAVAGIPGPADLEPLLFAAAAAWPAGKSPADTVRYETGRLSLPAADWRPDEIERFNAQLQAGGYSAVVADGRLQLGPTPRRGS